MIDADARQHSAAGILSRFSTIHLHPVDLSGVLANFRQLLATSGTLVLGFFDSDDEVAAFDHAVVTAYRWPAARLAGWPRPASRKWNACSGRGRIVRTGGTPPSPRAPSDSRREPPVPRDSRL
jgi:hypothetical protein